MTDIPVSMTPAGAQTATPAALLAALTTSVAATRPGYTFNLPGSLIEDISSTEIGSVQLIDSARVEAINSLTPFAPNPFLLRQLGAIYGVPLGQQSNTSVFVVFTGTPGFVVAKGFTVGDGTYQYVVQDGGIIGSGGTSPQLFALAVLTGSWAVPSGTVQQLITSVPTGVTLAVNNPTAGIPGAAAETQVAYNARVFQAGLAVAQGMTTMLKTTLSKVDGVQARLISALPQSGGGWEIIVGGGDPYQVAYAIFQSLFDISTLVGSTLGITAVTKANPGVVTTDLNHGFTTGQHATINNVVGMTQLNGNTYTITVIDEKRFSIGVNSSGFTTYVSGGVVTPNLRNISVSINDFPDTYVIPFVNPPQQAVTMTVTWNTTATNVVSPASVAQLGAAALADYINGINVGLPINLFELESTFQQAIASLVPPQLLTRMVFAVAINGVGVAPSAGTGIIAGDPSSYFSTSASDITITQG